MLFTNKGTKVRDICDGITTHLNLKGYVILEDTWITEYNKIIYNEKREPISVLDYKEIELNTLVNPTILPHLNGWKIIKFSCLKLDKIVNVGDILYT